MMMMVVRCFLVSLSYTISFFVLAYQQRNAEEEASSNNYKTILRLYHYLLQKKARIRKMKGPKWFFHIKGKKVSSPHGYVYNFLLAEQLY